MSYRSSVSIVQNLLLRFESLKNLTFESVLSDPKIMEPWRRKNFTSAKPIQVNIIGTSVTTQNQRLSG